MTGRLVHVLSGERSPGVYSWLSRAHPEAIRRDLEAAGWYCACLDGRPVRDRTEFFDACAAALKFPAWFGHNWSAFADCLEDLSWLPMNGYVVIWQHHDVLRRAEAETWTTAVAVLATAAETRASIGLPPLYVLLRGPADDLPRL